MNKKKIMDDLYIAISDEAYHRKNMELAQERIKECERFLNLPKKHKHSIMMKNNE